MGEKTSFPSAALKIRQREAPHDPIVVSLISSQCPNLRLGISAKLQVREQFSGLGPQFLAVC